MNIPTGLVGCAGEHFVAYVLSGKGCVVALPRGGAPTVDLMVSCPNGHEVVMIQVKTQRGAYRTVKRKLKTPDNSGWAWRASKRDPVVQDALFYAFVDIKQGTSDPDTGLPKVDVFIVPSADVAKKLAKNPGWFCIDEGRDDLVWKKNDWHLIEKKLGVEQP